jgi:hypothetical protein
MSLKGTVARGKIGLIVLWLTKSWWIRSADGEQKFNPRLHFFDFSFNTSSYVEKYGRRRIQLTAYPMQHCSRHTTLQRHCTVPKIGNKYSQKWNCAAMYLWAIYICPPARSLFRCSKIGGPIVGIYKSLTDTWMWKLGTRQRSFTSGNT